MINTVFLNLYWQIVNSTFPILCPGGMNTDTKLLSKNVVTSTFSCLPIVLTVCGI